MDTIPMVPRFVIEPALAELAEKLPPEGAIIVTDRPERLGPISSNLVRVLGLAATASSVIMIAPTTEAERAEVDRLKAAGQLRPIFHDPAMPTYRQPKRLKLEKRAARHARRCGHHADLIAAIEALPSGSSVLLVQSAEYGRHVSAMIHRLRPDLISPRVGIFIVACLTAENEASALAERPDYTANLPVIRMPGLRLARDRAASREARARSAAPQDRPASPIPAAPLPAASSDLAERVSTVERHLSEMIANVGRLVGVVEQLAAREARRQEEADHVRAVEQRLAVVRGLGR